MESYYSAFDAYTCLKTPPSPHSKRMAFSHEYATFKLPDDLVCPIVLGAAGAAVGALVTPVVAPVALGLIGFSPIGPVAGSMAAGIQAGIGNVAAGSPFAIAQSVAMGGAIPAAFVVAGAGVGAVSGAALCYLDGGDDESDEGKGSGRGDGATGATSVIANVASVGLGAASVISKGIGAAAADVAGKVAEMGAASAIGAGGPVAGTMAAGIQAGIGNALAGSLFATAQSVAMSGAIPLAIAAIGAGMDGVGGAATGAIACDPIGVCHKVGASVAFESVMDAAESFGMGIGAAAVSVTGKVAGMGAAAAAFF